MSRKMRDTIIQLRAVEVELTNAKLSQSAVLTQQVNLATRRASPSKGFVNVPIPANIAQYAIVLHVAQLMSTIDALRGIITAETEKTLARLHPTTKV